MERLEITTPASFPPEPRVSLPGLAILVLLHPWAGHLIFLCFIVHHP